MRKNPLAAIARDIVNRKSASALVLAMSFVVSDVGIAQDRSLRRPALTPKLALQLIANRLREPYAGNSIFFGSDGKLISNLSTEFAAYMIKEGFMRCGNTPTGEPDTHDCRLTEKGRKSPYFGTTEFRNRVNYYLRWSDAKNPQLLRSKIADASAVPFRVTIEVNSFGAKFFGNKTRVLEARAEFAYESGRWVLQGIEGMPGD